MVDTEREVNATQDVEVLVEAQRAAKARRLGRGGTVRQKNREIGVGGEEVLERMTSEFLNRHA